MLSDEKNLRKNEIYLVKENEKQGSAHLFLCRYIYHITFREPLRRSTRCIILIEETLKKIIGGKFNGQRILKLPTDALLFSLLQPSTGR